MVCLKNEEGEWIDDQNDISSCFAAFYENLFAGSGPRNFDSVLSYVKPVVSEDDNVCLMAPVKEEEIKEVAFELGSLKAPGPDGFPGIFYHHSWEVVGPEICRMVKGLFVNGGRCSFA